VKHLGFTLLKRMGPPFAMVQRGDLTLWLSGPASSAARPLPSGKPAPGGWNRLVIEVPDVPAMAETLKTAGVTLRSAPVSGPGGTQLVIDDPAGNPIELFTPA
jgi:catechol 2,3-dioxygenase-like lactoylglutathione lyase family enzyme